MRRNGGGDVEILVVSHGLFLGKLCASSSKLLLSCCKLVDITGADNEAKPFHNAMHRTYQFVPKADNNGLLILSETEESKQRNKLWDSRYDDSTK